MPLRLILRNLLKRPLRFTLTAGALMMAVFLVCVLQSLVVALDAGVREAKSDRIVVQSAVSLFVGLPLAYQSKIETVEGVERAMKMQWFGGIYQDSSGFFAQFGVDTDRLLEVYDEIRIVEGSLEQLRAGRTHCLIGKGLVQRYGWEPGSRIPLQSQIFTRGDGSPWEFTVAGIYESDSASIDENTMFFDFRYLEETLRARGETEIDAGTYILRIAPGTDAVRVMAQVDSMFENDAQRVQATSEAEFNAQFVSMLGNIPFFVSSIGGGVLAAIALAVLNTMIMAGREQSRDVGILKALGFTDRTVFAVLLGQSLLLCSLGGFLGLGLARLASGPISMVLSTQFPGYEVTPGVLGQAAAVALAIGLVAGITPAWRARKLEVVDALRGEA
ncbi:MAG: FtsX-like permease family protein [Planctomycetota bacterium]|nr:FtsX-like permease family protein [Planctomycetota bacterium]MDP6763975.1 FtsX-like permease family protein [Planctomycetota bacterium]MDP6988501.1 FtsX-like permease family protein [Planctomycetota bacterium]